MQTARVDHIRLKFCQYICSHLHIQRCHALIPSSLPTISQVHPSLIAIILPTFNSSVVPTVEPTVSPSVEVSISHQFHCIFCRACNWQGIAMAYLVGMDLTQAGVRI